MPIPIPINENSPVRIRHPTALAAPRTHYENFPVASWLCPPRIRPAVVAIYWFARTADDLADEGTADATTRLADLAAFDAELRRAGDPHGGAPHRWPEVFMPLRQAIAAYALPTPLLADLLSAFMQDVRKTAEGSGYADRAELLDYCARSANPIGRLLLHLYGVGGDQALAQSDAICSALQLINFWQDPSVDLPRRRRYFTDTDCRDAGIDPDQLVAGIDTPSTIKLIASCADWARASMRKGAPLVHAVPGRAGWELRLVVQGGLRILDKIDALAGRTLSQRPVLRVWDAPLILARALAM